MFNLSVYRVPINSRDNKHINVVFVQSSAFKLYITGICVHIQFGLIFYNTCFASVLLMFFACTV